MAEAIRLDIVLNSEEARRALDDYEIALLKAGKTAGEAAKEVEKFERSIREGAAKKEATRALRDIAERQREAGEAAEKAAEKTIKQTAASDALTGAVLRYVAPAAVGAAILKTVEWADRIATMAERTNLTTTQVQQLEKMAGKSGATFGQMASLIQAAEQRLAGHNQKAEEAVRLLGLAPEKLLAMDPLERLRAIAKGLADLEDPAKRSAAEVAILGQKADEAGPALNALAAGADKAERVLGEGFIEAGKKAQGVLDDIKNSALEMLRVIVLVGPTIALQAQKLDEARRASGRPPSGAVLGSTQGPFFDVLSDRYSAELALGNLPGIPGSPGPSWMPSPVGVPGSPMEGAAGQSWGFLNRFFGSSRTAKAGAAPVVPYTRDQWATIQQVLGATNPLGNGGLGSFPGWAMPDPLTSLMSRSALGIGFDRNSRMVPFAPTVPMNAPGAAGGGGFGGWLSGHKTQIAGLGLGLLSRFIPQGGKLGAAASMASQGASMGAMFGPWGMGIGAALGGITGLFTGGKAAKNARNAETSRVFEQFSTKEFVDLQKEADRFGISMQKALSAKTMKDFGAAVDEVREKVTQLTALEDEIAALKEAATVDFDKMNAIVNEFGLDVAKLGPAFQQALSDKESKRIIDAMAVMEKGGADMSGVLDGMADEISKVVSDSIKFGTTIPENMRPWVEKLIASGKLLDENGEKITDTSKIKFGAPMEAEMDRVVKKLDELIAKLAELTKGFQGAAGAAADLGNQDYPDPGSAGSGGGAGDTPGVSRGGIIRGKGHILYFRRGGFVPRGTDSVPAMLTPGEMVIARDTVKQIARGGGASSVTVNVNVAGYLDSPKVQRDLARIVVDQIDRDVRMRRVG